MGCRVLIVYASRFGSTAGVAEEVGRVLADRGLEADVRPVAEAPTPQDYDAVVVGSAIYNARWMPEAKEYVKTNHEMLNSVPSAFFQVCLSILNASATKERIIDSWMEPANRLAPPVAAATFPGAMFRSNITGGQRLLVWLSRVPDGDYRDWDAVRLWAEELGTTLTGELGTCE